MGLNWTIFQGSVSADFADVSRAKKKYKNIKQCKYTYSHWESLKFCKKFTEGFYHLV